MAMPGKLSTYQAKRNFAVTPEPRGEIAATSDRLRFVVQEHHARRLHYDFRLELDGTLKSWAVPKGPSLDPGEKRLAVQVEDHPLDYIGFHGDIPAHQYGAGHVEIWDSGYWEPRGDPLAGYAAGKLSFHLDGDRLQGGWTLVRTHMRGGGKEQWLLIKDNDEHAHRGQHGTESTGMTQSPSHAVPAPLPDMLSPQLATLVDDVPQEGDWIYEVKFDGYRLLARIDHGAVTLLTRDGKDWTARLPHQVRALRALDVDSAWLDGEIVVLDKDGVPSFQLLQNAFDQGGARIVYFLFDLPYCDGLDLRAVPLVQRRARLERLLQDAGDGPLRYSAPIEQAPRQLLDSACRLAIEGIIGKRADSPYGGRRNLDWIKLKCRQRQEFVIAGYTEPQGARKFFGALLLAVHDDDGKLRYAGRVGTGFDRETLHRVFRQLQPLQRKTPPFATMPAGLRRAGVHWVSPQLVAEVSFAEWTHEHLLRQAVFHGLRADKPAVQVRREEAAHTPARPRSRAAKADAARIENVNITHPDRVIDPDSGLTKLDLVRYYDAVAPRLLPFMKNRPVYFLRCPDGIAGEHFFQKHVRQTPIPGIRTLDSALDPGHAPLMAIDDASALVGAAQMGAVELHLCNACADRIERPDCMVFDLDPDPALPWERVVEGARLLRVVLDELGLRAFVKTSGGKGLHVVVPLARRHGWDEVTAFSQAVARHLAHTLPKHFSARMGEQNRVGKIFVDYLRNRRQASTVAPYSVRARSRLPVAMPLDWEELDDIAGAAAWTIASAPGRLAQGDADPWRAYFSTKQMLSAAMRRRLGLA